MVRGLYCFLGFSALLIFFSTQLFAQVTFEQKSNPAGLFATSTQTKNLNELVNTITPALSTSSHSFTHWTVNGVRENAPDGQAKIRVTVTLAENITAIAHYIADNNDSDSDGVPDWFEIRMFGNLNHDASYDGDNDGVTLAEERQFGLAATIKDDFMEGGASIRRSSQVFANFGGAKKLTVASDPPGLLTSSETFPETNSSYTSPNKNGLTNGHYFSHWEINGVRQADSQGLGLSQISLNMNEDKTVIAKYFPENEDTDSDGLPDWFEWHEFGSLDNNASSDPDADGLLMSEERQFGLSAVIKDEFMEGGASIRRSSQIFANFGGAKRLTVASDPPGLLTSSETFPETNSSYTSPNKNGLTNGHYFSHWEINGVRQADSQGLGLSQISLNIDGDKTIIAKYYLENEDTDSDGLPDWFEWHEFGSLDNNASSDPDADGMLMSEERQFGLSAVIKDEFMEGGGSIRRSGTFGYIEFQPNEDDDGDGLTKAQELQYGTSDDNTDSDGDGFLDGEEVTAGSDPANADSVPNRPPRDLNSTAVLAFQENQPVGTVIGEFNATDPDGDAITYHFVNGENNNSLFTIDTNGTLKTATTFDYESNASSYIITVQAKDEQNATIEGNFTVTLLNVYEDTDGDGFRDSLEASTGSNLNDPNSTPLQQGLVAWYPFDGNASDMSGNGNHGTVYGATLGTDRHGVTGKAYSFDGNDLIETASAVISAPPFSITSWVYRMESSSHPNSHLVNFSYGNGLQNNFTFFLKPNAIQIGTPGANDIGNDATFIPSEQWISVGVTSLSYNQNQTFFYLNGKKIIPDNQQGENNPFPQNSGQTVFGKTKVSDGTIQWHSGKIDDIRIYDRALSADEISMLYRTESPNHFVNSAKDLEMIWVEPGTFTMGSPESEADRGTDETEHNVTITQGFYLGKYEVTQAQYEAVIGYNPSEFNATGNRNRPVEDLNWTEALAFCEQLTIQERNAGRIPEDWAYVLPTESQWEYACRAGTTTVYSWGNDINSSHANYSFSGVGQTQEVGQYTANPWGFFDMHGNVWEWTADWYAVYPSDNPTIDPNGPASGSNRIYRGGSRASDHRYLRSAKRYARAPSFRYHDIGFRLALRDLNKAPTDLNSTAVLAFSENQPVGTVIGEFNATDPDGYASTYHFVNGDNNNSLFTLDANGTLKTATTFDYEINASSFLITVQAKDEQNATTEGNFTVTLLNVNDPPYDLNSTTALKIAENQPVGTVIGEFNATDPDANASITYHLVNGENNNSLFNLDSNGTLKTGTPFDYESNVSTYTITVQAKDELNATIDGNFTVYLINEIEDLDGDGIENHIDTDIDGDGISNMNEELYQTNPWDGNSSNLPPFNLRILEPLSLYINEPVGEIVGTVRADDPDGFHTLRYSMLPIFPSFAQNDESLIVWMDASKPIQIEEENGKVNKWKNKQVGSLDFITNPNLSNPTYGKRKYNGWRVIDFDGNAMLRSDGNLTLGENSEIFMVAGIDEIDSKVDSIFSSFVARSSSNFYFRSLDENGFLGRFNTSTMGKMRTFLNEPVIGAALFHLQFDYNEKTLRFRLNGVNQGKTDYTNPPDPKNEFRIFTQSSGQTGFTKGFVGELLIFNNLIAGGQRRLMESYLGTKWNLPVVDPLPNEFFETTQDGVIKTTKVFSDIDDFNQTLLIRAIDDHNLSVEKEFSVELLRIIDPPIDSNGTSGNVDDQNNSTGGNHSNNESNQSHLLPGNIFDNDYNQTVDDINTTTPSSPTFFVNRPIPQTLPVEFLSNGNYRFSGKILTDGGAPVFETGIILSKKIFLSDPIQLISQLDQQTMTFHSLHGTLEPGTTYYFRTYAKNRAGMTRGGLKKLTTPQIIDPGSWFASAQPLPGGWKMLEWWGAFRPTNQTWVYHAELGWLYPSASKSEGLWLWNEEHGWQWTDDGIYPYLFRWRDSTWIYFYQRVNGRPLFYNASLKRLE
jgi:formylglycine-generating enzyme required for sulfatase activity